MTTEYPPRCGRGRSRRMRIEPFIPTFRAERGSSVRPGWPSRSASEGPCGGRSMGWRTIGPAIAVSAPDDPLDAGAPRHGQRASWQAPLSTRFVRTVFVGSARRRFPSRMFCLPHCTGWVASSRSRTEAGRRNPLPSGLGYVGGGGGSRTCVSGSSGASSGGSIHPKPS